jgi:alkylation response protein AidB-like acyl-CoA dehydrogenase
MTEARVPASAVIGGLHNGWAAANTTLAHERSGLGAGGGSAAGGAATPGTVAKQLDRRAGDFVRAPGSGGRRRRGGGGPGGLGGASGMIVELAKASGQAKDPIVRQDLVRLHTMNELARYNNLRLKAEKQAGRDIPGMANISKLAMSDILRLSRDLGLRVSGPAGMLHAYKSEDQGAITDATKNPFVGMVTGMALYAQGPPIYGGTDQIQRNIIGERVLGLPKEPNEDRVKPFSELPKNA